MSTAADIHQPADTRPGRPRPRPHAERARAQRANPAAPAETTAAAVAASRVAQGLPPTICDPAVLAQLGRLLDSHARRCHDRDRAAVGDARRAVASAGDVRGAASRSA
jgi:hypothetical protein